MAILATIISFRFKVLQDTVEKKNQRRGKKNDKLISVSLPYTYKISIEQ